jgi:tetratricopeptide (TPR) repeat protein
MSKRRAERRAREPQAAVPMPRAASAAVPWWPIAFLLLAGAAIYGNSLSNPFVFDDNVSVVNNTSIREWTSGILFAGREVPTAGRPLVNVSMALNYALGVLDVHGYHLWNVAMHLLCTLLLFACARLTLRLPRMPQWLRDRSSDVAFAIALLWAAHPLNSEVVDYVTQRSESMMALAFLATIYASARALESHRSGWRTLAVTACALGMACKESMVTVPVAVVLYDATLIFDSLAQAVRARWRFYAALAATWLILAALLQTGARVHSAGFSTGVSSWTYLLNQTVMIVRYLRLSMWPSSLVVNYGWPRPVTLPDVFVPALVTVVLAVVTLFTLRRRPMLGFPGAWFFLTLAPTSSVLPIATEVGAERRMYLPLIALVGLALVGLAWLSGRFTRGRPVATAAAVALLAVALGATTMARNREYASPLGLAETVLARWPTPAAQAAVGQELAIVGRHDEAIARLREVAPQFPRASYHLGGELFNQGRIDEAVPSLEAFVRAEPLLAEVVPARTMIGRAFMLQKRWPEAEAQLRLVLTMSRSAGPARATAMGFLADTLFAEQKFAEAQAAYVAYLGERPSDAGAMTNLAVSLSALGRLDEAVAAFRKAVEMNPRDAQARRNLAIALEDQAHAAKR